MTRLGFLQYIAGLFQTDAVVALAVTPKGQYLGLWTLLVIPNKRPAASRFQSQAQTGCACIAVLDALVFRRELIQEFVGEPVLRAGMI